MNARESQSHLPLAQVFIRNCYSVQVERGRSDDGEGRGGGRGKWRGRGKEEEEEGVEEEGR